MLITIYQYSVVYWVFMPGATLLVKEVADEPSVGLITRL